MFPRLPKREPWATLRPGRKIGLPPLRAENATVASAAPVAPTERPPNRRPELQVLRKAKEKGKVKEKGKAKSRTVNPDPKGRPPRLLRLRRLRAAGSPK